MVSFPPAAPDDDASKGASADDARLAPVTNLSDARRSGSERSGSRWGSSSASNSEPRGMRAHPSVRQLGRADAQRSQQPEREPVSEEKAGKRASNVSMHQLARRGMSRWELEQVLAKREIEPEVA